jgi:hypothetical protein
MTALTLEDNNQIIVFNKQYQYHHVMSRIIM